MYLETMFTVMRQLLRLHSYTSGCSPFGEHQKTIVGSLKRGGGGRGEGGEGWYSGGEHFSSTWVTWVWFLDLVSHVVKFVVGSYPCTNGFSPGTPILYSPPSTKTKLNISINPRYTCTDIDYNKIVSSIHSFWLFRGLSYGMSGPMAHLPDKTAAVYKWMDSWEV